MLKYAWIAGSAMVASLLIPTSAALGQDLQVDTAGANPGDLSIGTLKFGGPEPMDPHLCLISHRGPGPCPPGPTLEGIASTRIAERPIKGKRFESTNLFGLDFYTADQPRLSITHAGRIGIGIRAPAYDVHVRHSGDVQIAIESTDGGHRLWTLQSSGSVVPEKAGTFQIIDRDQNIQRLGIDKNGIVSVKALQITGGADVAEPFNTGSRLEPGSLVVIDDAHPGQLIGSSRAYDRRVAGVVSGANDVLPGVTLEQLEPGGERQQIALSGRVYALADTSNGPIHAGDLLTSSNNPAHAMRATNLKKAQGAIIGKAMSGLEHGSGLVLMLVSLQ